MAITRTKTLLGAQAVKLKKYQSGEIRVVRTNRPHIDDTLSGLLPGDIVVVAGASGSGKTFELQTLRENIMSTTINPNADNFVFLDLSFEMKLFNVILRGLARLFGKKKKEVLLNEFDEAEKSLANRYIKTLTDNRFYINETPCTPGVFISEARAFLTEHVDKDAVFIAIDHMGLFKSNGERKANIDEAVEGINLLKREFDNAYFILLSQLNRGILGRIKDACMSALPNRGDLYQSDTMFQIADYLYVVHNPNRLGINKYLKVNPLIYEDLEEFFIRGTGLSKKVSFETFGNIFFHVLKVREGEVIFKDIYIEEILSEEMLAYKKERIDVISEGFDDLDIEDEEKF